VAGDDTAAVDVADQHHRHARRPGEAHIGDVVPPEIDLRRAARAFDDHDIAFRPKMREAIHHKGQQLRLERLIVAGARLTPDAALHDDLGADLALRLEQHRVHMDRGRHAAGLSL
jgi:hypothetical protein